LSHRVDDTAPVLPLVLTAGHVWRRAGQVLNGIFWFTVYRPL